jgi:hypothetical protein
MAPTDLGSSLPAFSLRFLPQPVCIVSFDLNYPGATGPPRRRRWLAAQARRGLSDPVRAGWSFRDGTRAASLGGWDFGARSRAGRHHALGRLEGTRAARARTVSSIEFGHQEGRPDYCAPMAIPEDSGTAGSSRLDQDPGRSHPIRS